MQLLNQIILLVEVFITRIFRRVLNDFIEDKLDEILERIGRPNTYLKSVEVLEYLGTSKTTLQRIRDSNLLKVIKLRPGKKPPLRYRITDIEDYLDRINQDDDKKIQDDRP